VKQTDAILAERTKLAKDADALAADVRFLSVFVCVSLVAVLTAGCRPAASLASC
jgi:hypothetical protein